MPTPTRIDIPAAARADMARLLNASLAEAIDLWARSKHAHWNVKGPTFQQLHELFDKVAEQAEEFADDLAERAAALGESAEGRLKAVAERSSLKAYPDSTPRSADHVAALSDAIAAFGAKVRRSIDAASNAGDQGTADLFTSISRDNDKLLWMVEAHLQS